MNTGKGVVGILVALGAVLLVSSANTKTAEARSSARASATEKSVPVAGATVAGNSTPTTADATTAREPAVVAAPLGAEVITPPQLLENRKLRRMQKAEISPAMQLVAAQIVHRHYAKPVGTQVEVEVEGKRIYARIERHFHPEGGAVKPWGFHPGVSLFVER